MARDAILSSIVHFLLFALVCDQVRTSFNAPTFHLQPLFVMGMKTTKTNDKKIYLNLNPKHKTHDQNKNTKAKIKNTKCVRPKYKHIFITMK